MRLGVHTGVAPDRASALAMGTRYYEGSACRGCIRLGRRKIGQTCDRFTSTRHCVEAHARVPRKAVPKEEARQAKAAWRERRKGALVQPADTILGRWCALVLRGG